MIESASLVQASVRVPYERCQCATSREDRREQQNLRAETPAPSRGWPTAVSKGAQSTEHRDRRQKSTFKSRKSYRKNN